MLEKLASIAARYDELERLIADPALINDYQKITEYSKERAGLDEIIEHYRRYQREVQELEEARLMVDAEDDAELRTMAQEEVTRLETSMTDLLDKLKTLLLPKDPRDDKNVIMEIRAGAGGDEA
ncbi:MAG: PCRF domain-containing protein, partial [Anaerolineae bacterium]|nr:PCRF domain-containing protein [Anaerolineae bacterium]